jgi:hypothetical protein
MGRAYGTHGAELNGYRALEAKRQGKRAHLRPWERWKDIVKKMDVTDISCKGMD